MTMANHLIMNTSLYWSLGSEQTERDIGYELSSDAKKWSRNYGFISDRGHRKRQKYHIKILQRTYFPNQPVSLQACYF